jgi:hypothetical protein
MNEANARRLSVGMRVGFACFVAVSSLRCSLLVDTNGLSGGPAASPDGDAPDGSSDAPGGDALLDADVGFRDCDATPHDFCDDFDNGVFGARWSGQTLTNGGVVSLDDAGLSPPNALRATLVPLHDGGNGGAALFKNIMRVASFVSCEFDVQILEGDFQAFDLSFEDDAGVTTYGVSFNVGDTSPGAHLREYTVSGSTYVVLHQYSLPAMATGVWHHASFVVSIAGGDAGSATLTIDGTPFVDARLAPKPALSLYRLTLSETFTTDPFDALYDNVHCDIH